MDKNSKLETCINEAKILKKLAITPQKSVYFSTNPKIETHDALDSLKFFFKKFGNLYSTLVHIISPVCPTLSRNKLINKFNIDSDIVINIGSGNSNIHPNVINFDIYQYPNVDIVGNAYDLPLKDNSVDGIISIAMLEHVPNPSLVVKEFFRVLKPGAKIECLIPFIQGFHASPHDFTRFTTSGMKELFKDFEIIEIRPEGGPTSALLWIFQEWLALVLSLGSRRLHTLISLIIMILTFPLKFLDFILILHPKSSNISSLFGISCIKLPTSSPNKF